MIGKLAKKVAQWFVKNKTQFNNIEVYQYAFFIIFSVVIFFIITIIIGAILGVLFESITFYFLFVLIRIYAGGYHASKEIICDIITSASIIICVFLIRLSKGLDFQIPLFAIAIISVLCILTLCPLDTPEKPLTDKEFYHYRKISYAILLVISVLILVSFIFELKLLFAPSCLSLILENILLIAGKVKKVYQLKNAEQ